MVNYNLYIHGRVTDNDSFGHFYVEINQTDNSGNIISDTQEMYGVWPVSALEPVAEIKDERNIHNSTLQAIQNGSQGAKIITSDVISLTEQEYFDIKNYINDNLPYGSLGAYFLTINDCIRFVERILDAANENTVVAGYFTSQDLDKIGTAGWYTDYVGGSLPNNLIVYSEQKLQELTGVNIDEFYTHNPHRNHYDRDEIVIVNDNVIQDKLSLPNGQNLWQDYTVKFGTSAPESFSLSGDKYIVDGGDGNDTISYASSGSAVNVDLDAGNTLQSGIIGFKDIFDNIEAVTGSAFDDTILGHFNDANTITGNGGNDELVGGNEDDVLQDFSGNNMLEGGNGNDTYKIGSSSFSTIIDNGLNSAGKGEDSIWLNDIYVYSGFFIKAIGVSGADLYKEYSAANNDFLIQKAGADLNIIAGGGNVTATIKNFNYSAGNPFGIAIVEPENVYRTSSNEDFISGSAGNDIITNGHSNTTLSGGDGVDFISASGGATSANSFYGKTYIDAGSGEDSIVGSNFNDTIFAGSGNDSIMDAGNGNDFLAGGAGNDVLVDGYFNDFDHYIFSSESNSKDVITFFNANDRIELKNISGIHNFSNLSFNGSTLNLPNSFQIEIGGSFTASNFIITSSSANSITGSSSVDIINALDGNDTIYGGLGNDTLNGGAGDDTVIGESNDDSLSGNAGNDFVDGTDGNDSVYGNLGDDTLWGGPGTDIIYGGDGNDQITTWTESDTVYGGDGNDFIIGQHHSDFLNGEAGDDGIFGSDNGNDTINGGAGNDFIVGNAGDDSLSGGQGNDHLIGGDGLDTFQGGAGIDTLWMDNGDDIGYGGIDNDELHGWFGNDTLYGGDGNDLLLGQFDNDSMIGGDGNDHLIGSVGNDTMHGSAGDDTLWMDEDNDIGYGEGGNDFIGGWTGNDTLNGAAGNDTLEGHDGDDEINAGGDDDVAYGGNGNDTLTGNGGNDLLDGGTGNDNIIGNTGIDTIGGGTGADTLTGSGGVDTFKYFGIGDSTTTETDLITDFNNGVDKIDLSGLGFTGITAGAASGTTLGYSQSGGITTITDGNNFIITLTGNINLVNTDFVF